MTEETTTIETITLPVNLVQRMIDTLQELPHKQVAGVLSDFTAWQAAQSPLAGIKQPAPPPRKPRKPRGKPQNRKT